MPPKVSRWNRRKPRIAPLLHAAEELATRACHEALRSEPFWSNLRLDGFALSSGTDRDVLELRRCPQCGSSISKSVPPAAVLGGLRDALGVVSRSLNALAANALAEPRRPRSNSHA